MIISRRALLALPALVPALRADASGLDTAKSIGRNYAPITYELFSDFQCPACERFHHETIRPMIQDYVRPGKVYLVWRDFPLPIHPFARSAANVAAAAAHIGKFEVVSNALYDNQAKWSPTGDLDPVLRLVLSAAEVKRVRELAKTPAILQSVENDINAARAGGINQTPTSILTHRIQPNKFAGAVSYAILRRFLDNLLSK